MANEDEMKKHSAESTGDHLDRMLDAALTKYASVEPRAGLEERILANLRGADVPVRETAWRMWGFAATVAILLVIGMLGWRWSRPAHPPIAHHSSPAPHTPAVPESATREENARTEKKPARHRVVPRSQHEIVAAEPKLDVFPSPLPLTTEEVALAQYVRDFPKEAQLVAQAQEDFDRETQKEMNAGSETRQSGSIQQER
ncbi:MAG TPA: hypothetical protein VMU05_21895 [Dongiaceae bacterium]|nr:hypothetical protein [Dongiaceae bacterium]